MTYATRQMMIDSYGEQLLVMLTDRAEEPTGEIDEDVLNRALASADARIDGFLQGRYTLPLSETPPLIAEIAQVIAIRKLHRHSPNDEIKDAHKEAMALLDRIGDGRARLSVAGIEPAGSNTSGARITDRDRPLTAENLKGFI